ncbi:MAG: hypothetical protein AAFV87_10895 [Pseudomonadota bacterium]
MSRYTRFPNRDAPQNSSIAKGLKGQSADAERLFRSRPAPPLTRYDKTTRVAKQVVLEEPETRRTLSKALRSARLERAERSLAKAGNKRVSTPDE